MSALLVLLFVALWFGVAVVLAIGLAKALPARWWRWPVAGVALAAALVAPLLDEIIGGRQFAARCQANASIHIDRKSGVGRRVYEAEAAFVDVEGTVLPVRSLRVDFIDADTGEPIVGYRDFSVRGGWLSQWLRFSETRVPLTFEGECSPGGRGRLAALFKERHITLIRRPQPTAK